jgi:predicted ester cyclase
MSTTTQQERNADAVRRIAAAVSAGGDLAVLDELLTTDYVEHNPAQPTDARGPDVIRRFVEPYRAAFPDLEIVEEDLLAVGDRVVFRHRVRGTHEREFRGIEPTGVRVEVEGIAIYRFEDGHAAEKWLVFDALGLLQQLGVAPAPPASGE